MHAFPFIPFFFVLFRFVLTKVTDFVGANTQALMRQIQEGVKKLAKCIDVKVSTVSFLQKNKNKKIPTFCPFTCSVHVFPSSYFSACHCCNLAIQEIQDGRNGYPSDAEVDQVYIYTPISFPNLTASRFLGALEKGRHSGMVSLLLKSLTAEQRS